MTALLRLVMNNESQNQIYYQIMKLETEKIYYPIWFIPLLMSPDNAQLFPTTH